MGAQNGYWEAKGAFTGEVSAPMLVGTASYLLVGHSERRTVFGETDEQTNRKMHATAEAGLTPILAVGETIEQMRGGETEATLRRQVTEGLRDFATLPAGTVIAYEPVWAIGTGEAATPEVAQERCAFIRSLLAELFGAEAAEATRIQYGGSVNAANAATYFAQPDVDGALVGGASLKADSFSAIIAGGLGPLATDVAPSCRGHRRPDRVRQDRGRCPGRAADRRRGRFCGLAAGARGDAHRHRDPNRR